MARNENELEDLEIPEVELEPERPRRKPKVVAPPIVLVEVATAFGNGIQLPDGSVVNSEQALVVLMNWVWEIKNNLG